MAAPILPEEACAIRVSPTSSPCEVAESAAKTTDILCRLLSWMINTDGEPGDAFKEWIGAIGGGTGTGGGTSLAAPTGVVATSDRTTDVRVTWNSVSAATSYTVYRGTTADTAAMSAIASQSDTSPYLDTSAVVGTHYFYAVKASNALLNSGFSAVSEGVRAAATLTPVTYANPGTIKEVHPPTGATTMELWIWGGGGPGGHNTRGNNVFVPVGAPLNAYGGGGASGSFMRITGITVSESESYFIDIGASGEPTFVYRASVGGAESANATAGGAGGNATSGTPGTAGQPATSPGDCNFGGSSSVAAESTAGNEGDVGVTTGVGGTPTNPPQPVGGDPVVNGGYSAGRGGSASRDGTIYPGSNGMVRMIFT